MQRIRESLLWILATPLTLWPGFAAHRSDDTPITLGLVFLFAAAFAAVSPRRPWRWGLFWGLSVAVAGLTFLAPGLRLRYLAHPAGVLPSLIALVPAFLGAYTGASIRSLSAHAGGGAVPSPPGGP